MRKGNKTLDLNGTDALFVESFRALKKENDEPRDRVEALEMRSGQNPLGAGS